MIVGEAPNADEERLGRPFVGASGQLLDKWLMACGVRRDACWIGNVVNYRPPQNKLESKTHAWITEAKGKAEKFGCVHEAHGLYFNDLVKEGVEELHQEISRVLPRLIVALGNTPLWALTGRTGISSWRGSELWAKYDYDQVKIPVIPTYHPTYVLRVWEWNPMVMQDLRFRAFGKMATPVLREQPPYRFRIRPTLEQVAEWCDTVVDEALAIGGGYIDLTADIEGWGKVDCIGFGWSDLDAICIPFVKADGQPYWSLAEEPLVKDIVRGVLMHPRVRLIGQNFNYDAQCIECSLGIVPRVEFDTMAAQHLMLPGTPKDLAYLSSMYRRHHVYWKDDLHEAHETRVDELEWRYNCMDCVAPFEIAARQREQLVKRGLWRGR